VAISLFLYQLAGSQVPGSSDVQGLINAPPRFGLHQHVDTPTPNYCHAAEGQIPAISIEIPASFLLSSSSHWATSNEPRIAAGFQRIANTIPTTRLQVSPALEHHSAKGSNHRDM